MIVVTEARVLTGFEGEVWALMGCPHCLMSCALEWNPASRLQRFSLWLKSSIPDGAPKAGQMGLLAAFQGKLDPALIAAEP